MARFNNTFGFLRPQCPTPTIAATSGGNLTAGSLWLGIVRQNRVGFDIPAPLQQITWTTGQKVVITLPAGLRVDDSEDVYRVWVIAATTNTPNQTEPLTCWRGYQLNQIGTSGYYTETRNTLPATLELTEDSQVQLGAVVANPAALLTLTDVLDGQLRFVTSLNQTFYYDPVSVRAADGLTVLDATPNPGKWLQWPLPDLFSLGSIIDTTSDRGANRDTRLILDAEVLEPPPRYRMDGTTSAWVQYTIFNGYLESGAPIEAGSRLLLDIYQSGALKSQLFNRRVLFKLLGVSRFSNGSLSTAGLTVNSEITYTYGNPVYILEADLQPGYGLSFAIAFQFDRAELDGEIQVGSLAVKPYFSKQSGNFYPGYRLTGDLIYSLEGLRRVLPKPGAIAYIAQGAGVVQRFEFDLRSAFNLTLPSTNVSDQKITINSNGDVFWRGSDALLVSEVLRALVSLEVGRSNPSPWSSYTAYLATDSLEITVTYPTAIRANYPDVIAGSTAADGAEFNAPFVVLYIQRQSDGEIREFVNNATLPGTDQSFTITSFTAGTVIASLPTTVGDFGLWEATTAPDVDAIALGGSIGAATYRVAYAFRYDGTTLTTIDHSTTSGCIAEFDITLATIAAMLALLQQQIDGWADGSNSIDVLNLTARGNTILRSLVELWADELTLNSDAAGTGADWSYTLARPTTGMTADQIFKFPAESGTAGYALVSDGANGHTYASLTPPSPNPSIVVNFNSTSPVAWFTLPAGVPLLEIRVVVTQTFNSSSGGLSVGIAGTTAKYVSASALVGGGSSGNLSVGNQIILPCDQAPPASDEAIIITNTLSGASQGSAIFYAVYYQ